MSAARPLRARRCSQMLRDSVIVDARGLHPFSQLAPSPATAGNVEVDDDETSEHPDGQHGVASEDASRSWRGRPRRRLRSATREIGIQADAGHGGDPAAAAAAAAHPPRRRRRRTENRHDADTAPLQRQFADVPAAFAADDRLRQAWLDAFAFHDDLHKLSFPEPCSICFESWPDMSFVVWRGQRVCKRCAGSKNTEPYHQFSDRNNVNPAREVPRELKDLTLVEEALISIVSPMVRVVELPYRGIGYSGHVISFPKDLTDLCHRLPRTTVDVIKVRRTRHRDRHRSDSSTAGGWAVRSGRSRCAAAGDDDAATETQHPVTDRRAPLSSEAVSHPDAGVPADGHRGGAAARSPDNRDDLDGQAPLVEDEEEEQEQDNGEAVVDVTIPQPPPVPNVEAEVRRGLRLDWPAVRYPPVCEYSVPGLFGMAFPTLFPGGAGDFTCGQGAHPIALALYIKHLMRYGDPRFRRHKIFRYYLFNFHRRHAVRGQASVFVARNRCSIGGLEQVQRLLAENRHEVLVQRLVAFTASTPGSSAFWKSGSGRVGNLKGRRT